jgi:hypothetical protein
LYIDIDVFEIQSHQLVRSYDYFHCCYPVYFDVSVLLRKADAISHHACGSSVGQFSEKFLNGRKDPASSNLILFFHSALKADWFQQDAIKKSLHLLCSLSGDLYYNGNAVCANSELPNAKKKAMPCHSALEVNSDISKQIISVPVCSS